MISNVSPNMYDAMIYLKCLISLSKADGKIHEKEKTYIEMQADLYSITLQGLWEADFIADSNQLSRLTKLAKISIIRDLLVLSYIDGDFHLKEEQEINEIARKMDLEQSKIQLIKNWLKKYVEVLEESYEIFK